MSPEATLAELVDVFLSRDRGSDPFLAAVSEGISEIHEAFGAAQEKKGDWDGMLAKLRSGSTVVKAGINHLRGQAGLERFVEFAEGRAKFADTMIEQIVRLQSRESTLVREDDVYLDYPFEDAKFRVEQSTGKVFRRFYGQAENEIRRDSELYTQARLSGRKITRDEYYAD